MSENRCERKKITENLYGKFHMEDFILKKLNEVQDKKQCSDLKRVCRFGRLGH
jgi:hypothetical protein